MRDEVRKFQASGQRGDPSQPGGCVDKIRFVSPRSNLLFDYLVNAFIKDYMRRRYTLEKSGWRSVTEAAHEIGLSPTVMYRKRGGFSPFVNELVREGFAEIRVFPGERGRGGEISRLRICYEKKPIQALVDRLAFGAIEGEERIHPLDSLRVAVLPFDNTSPDPGDEYFSDGMTEELISTLSKIKRLSVISRSSVMQYKTARKPVKQIGRELEAGTILEGSVRKSGNRVRVTIEMIDAVEDKHLWAENYNRELQDIFSVQSDIAGRVAEKLQVQLLSGEKEEIEEVPTRNVEAHTLYLKGCYHVDKGPSPEDMEKGITYFELAVVEDPQFALAYAALATIYVNISGESMPASKAIPKAKEALDHALSLNAGLAEAHNAKGWIAFQFDWDWVEAENGFKQALAIKPSLAVAHDDYGLFLASMGRFDEAISEARRAQELDPASPLVGWHYGLVCWMGGANERARRLFAGVVKAHPKFARARLGLAFVNATEHRNEEAIKEIEAAIAISDDAYFHGLEAIVHAFVGSEHKTREILRNILSGKYKGYASPGDIGAAYYLLGDSDEGYQWFKKAYEEHDVWLAFCSKWPIAAPLRADPRFLELLGRMRLS
jgi:TolB-like protein/Flp pilus assembly protein TadD